MSARIKMLLFIYLIFTSMGFSAETELYLHLESENQIAVPRNFRMASSPYTIEVNPIPSRSYLEKLKLSGSGQFSEGGLKEIIKRVPNQKIVVLDLRQEWHGFINGSAIGWKHPTDLYFYNEGKQREEIEANERKKLADIHELVAVILDPLDKPLEYMIEKVETERQLTSRLGLDYFRFFVKDTCRPIDQEVDCFIDIVKNLPPNGWLHIHCAGGLGRTTTFMILFDMMHNAAHLDAETFIRRHRALGGQELFNLHDQPGLPDSYKHEAAVARLKFLFDFHRYCTESDHFSISWSEWNAAQRDR